MQHRLRLYSGLILLLYVIGHIGNLSLGLVSVELMNAGQILTLDPWRTPPGAILLYGALLIHAGNALWSLFKRNSLRLKLWEAAQLLLGLTIPILLASHAIGTRGVMQAWNADPSYFSQLAVFWVFSPATGMAQTAGLIVAWLHACVGVHAWLKQKPFYHNVKTYVGAGAVILPTAALSGFVATGIRVRTLAEDPAWVPAMLTEARLNPEISGWVGESRDSFWLIWLGLIALVLVLRWLRIWIAKRRQAGQIYYRTMAGTKMIEHRPGWTLLEAFKLAGISHPSVCGGRGRCSTCRVKVTGGLDTLDLPSPLEKLVLSRIDAPDDVRLACQVRSAEFLSVTPLLPPTASAADGFQKVDNVQGHEHKIVILFIDIRESTKLAEQKLPFDVVFILNQFFAEMSGALQETNGHYAQFNGDGLMALYGLEGDFEAACRDALRGAAVMFERLDALNHKLAEELPQPLRMGIGIHSGEAIVGKMGPPETPILSALGDNVNIAARLEASTKEFGVSLVVSAETFKMSGA
ncbi:MAG: adenylate/guanylate cyclase domain-containing protein, partial [Proteobacteria bacterium]|nr:adenylate/guanylate cyclase domain-containing protein [Pseudomonadota bacterium]